MSQRKLCIFTPTYNRRHTLPELYQSLEEQGCSDEFIWLIVDDGSTDDTESYIKGIQENATFPIEYMKVANGGKQRAINAGVRVCEQELFFSIDSDDMVAPNAVRLILDTWEAACQNAKCAGIVGLDADPDGNLIGSSMPDGLEWVTSLDLYEKHKFKGDTTRIYRTDVLREHPFEVADGEKFVSESSAFYDIDQEYVLKVLDAPLMIVEYRQDGYSNNARQITIDNPIGYYKLKQKCIVYHSSLWQRYMDSILYLVGCDLANKRDGIKDAPNKVLAVLAWLPAKLVKRIMFSTKG